MELTRHAGKGTMDDTDHLAGLGIGIVLTHEMGVVEIGVAQGTKLFHVLVRYLIEVRRMFLTEDIPGNGTLRQDLQQATLATVLLQKNEVVDHRQQHSPRTAFPVGLLGVHHGNEVAFAFLGEKLADFQFLAVE